MNKATEDHFGSGNNSNKAGPVKKLKPSTAPGGKKGGLFIIILLFVSLVFFSRNEAVVTVECTPEMIARKPDVIMLGAWWCRYCYQAKRYFQQNNIHYCEYDMENTDPGKQLYEKYGGGLPVLLIGKYKLNGFSEQQIETALSLVNK